MNNTWRGSATIRLRRTPAGQPGCRPRNSGVYSPPGSTTRWRRTRCASNRGRTCCSPSKRWPFAMLCAVRTAPGVSLRGFTNGCTAVARSSSGSPPGAPRSPSCHVVRHEYLTWPVVTVFGFLAQPDRHMFLKPNVTRLAASRYGFEWHYQSRPAFTTYRELLALARTVKADQHDLGPRDLIDVQSFLWVQGSEQYQGRSFRPVHTTRVA